MKNYLMKSLHKLARESGYSFKFLLGVWNECVADGQSWDFFQAVTLERDW